MLFRDVIVENIVVKWRMINGWPFSGGKGLLVCLFARYDKYSDA